MHRQNPLLASANLHEYVMGKKSNVFFSPTHITLFVEADLNHQEKKQTRKKSNVGQFLVNGVCLVMVAVL